MVCRSYPDMSRAMILGISCRDQQFGSSVVTVAFQ